MPYNLTWSDATRVLYLEFEGVVNMNDFYELNAKILRELDAVDNPIILIINTANVQRLPSMLDELKLSQQYNQHINLARIFIVSTDKLVRLILTITFGLSKAHLHFFSNLNQAREFIRTVTFSS